MFSLSLWVLVGAYWGVGSWWALVFVVCRGAWSSCGAVFLRPGAVLGCGAAWDRGLCSWRCVVYFMFLVVLWWVAENPLEERVSHAEAFLGMCRYMG